MVFYPRGPLESWHQRTRAIMQRAAQWRYNTAGLWQHAVQRGASAAGSGCCQTVFSGTLPSYQDANASPAEVPLIQTSSAAAEASDAHEPQ